MRVTIIPADRWISRDNDAVNLPEWPFNDANIHAIQWYDTEGEIEYTGRPKPPNQIITDDAVLQPYLSAFDAHLEAKAEAANASAAIAISSSGNLALEQILNAQP